MPQLKQGGSQHISKRFHFMVSQCTAKITQEKKYTSTLQQAQKQIEDDFLTGEKKSTAFKKIKQLVIPTTEKQERGSYRCYKGYNNDLHYPIDSIKNYLEQLSQEYAKQFEIQLSMNLFLNTYQFQLCYNSYDFKLFNQILQQELYLFKIHQPQGSFIP